MVLNDVLPCHNVKARQFTNNSQGFAVDGARVPDAASHFADPSSSLEREIRTDMRADAGAFANPEGRSSLSSRYADRRGICPEVGKKRQGFSKAEKFVTNAVHNLLENMVEMVYMDNC